LIRSMMSRSRITTLLSFEPVAIRLSRCDDQATVFISSLCTFRIRITGLIS